MALVVPVLLASIVLCYLAAERVHKWWKMVPVVLLILNFVFLLFCCWLLLFALSGGWGGRQY
jgi:hypothetical protein